MTECKTALGKWFAAHDAHHKARDAYNSRLELIRAERERGNWTMRLDREYAALNNAERAALAADQELYGELCNGGETEDRR